VHRRRRNGWSASLRPRTLIRRDWSEITSLELPCKDAWVTSSCLNICALPIKNLSAASDTFRWLWPRLQRGEWPPVYRLRHEDGRLPLPFRHLDSGASLAVCLCLTGGGKVHGGNLLITCLDYLVHCFLHIRRGLISLSSVRTISSPSSLSRWKGCYTVRY